MYRRALSQVNAELEGGAAVEGVLLKPSWQKGNSDRPTLEVKAQLADLSKLSKLSKGKLSIDDVRDALRHYLPEFLGILEDKRERKQGKGSENWHFILTLWSTELQENQKQFNAVWERKKSRETDVPDVPPNSTTNDNWHNICRTSLEKQKQLTTNRLMSAKQMLFDINQICVDLALVERKQPDKRSGDDNPAQSQLYKPDYEETQKLEYKDFLTKVLKSEQSKKLAIIGEPGAGKTTLLQRIAFWILENTDDLPIWIPLGNFPNPAPKFKDYLLNDWLEDAIPSVTPKIKTEFEELLMVGKVWLLLDGVDEMAAKSGSPLTAIANRIVGWCDRLRVVLTCRLNVWEANPYFLNGFQTYRTLEFSEEKVEERDKTDENIRLLVQVADSLGKIDPSNPKVLPVLLKYINPIQDEIQWRQSRKNLLENGLDFIWYNSAGVGEHLLQEYKRIRLQAFDRLKKIAPFNPDVIPALLNLIKSTQHKDIETCMLMIECLGEIGADNTEALAILEQLIEPTQPEDFRRITAESLGKISPNHPQAIAELVNLTRLAENKYIRRLAVRSLGKIGRGNPDAITALKQLVKSTEDEFTIILAAENLRKLEPDNAIAIEKLENLITWTADEKIRRLAAESLEKTFPNHPRVIPELVKLIQSTEDGNMCWRIVDSLKKNLRKEDQMAQVVTSIKGYLSEESRKNNSRRYRECYKLICHCAQNMTYPDFYHAWHQQEEAGKRTNPDRQTLNQADLAQSLQSAIANDPQLSQTIHLICIDGSQFIEPDRPAAEIYDQMLDQNCPECDRAVPETMPALKLYWKSLRRKSNKRVVLVFYASSTDATLDEGTTLLCPYSSAFLTVLSKFGREICAIAEQRFEHISLKFFAPSQSIEDIVQWIRAIVLEN